MNRWMRVVLCGVVLVLIAGQSEAQVEIRAGGGLLLNPSRWCGHVSIDIPIGDTHPTYLSPFVEFYRQSSTFESVNAIPIGLNLLYKAPFSQEYGMVYFGVGGGLYRVSGTLNGIDFSGNPITLKDSSTQGMFTAGGGLQLDFSDALGAFVQTRWIRAFASGSKNELSLMAGLSFKLGEE